MTALQRQQTGQNQPSAGEPHGQASATFSPAPAQASTALARPSRWTDAGLWRRWALRLLGVWVLLSLLMVAQRVATADIRPALLEARDTHETLVEQRDTLSLEVQTLGSASRIHQWAEETGMLRFADSLKRSAEFENTVLGDGAATLGTLEPSSSVSSSSVSSSNASSGASVQPAENNSAAQTSGTNARADGSMKAESPLQMHLEWSRP